MHRHPGGSAPLDLRELMYQMADLEPDQLSKVREALHGGDEEAVRGFLVLPPGGLERASQAFQFLTGLKP